VQIEWSMGEHGVEGFQAHIACPPELSVLKWSHSTAKTDPFALALQGCLRDSPEPGIAATWTWMFPCIDSYKPAAETKPVYAVQLARVLVSGRIHVDASVHLGTVTRSVVSDLVRCGSAMRSESFVTERLTELVRRSEGLARLSQPSPRCSKSMIAITRIALR